ncbi:hypothetical protein [Lichenicoccus sp.]|uniref:hypothetical protein n=1 Tax=Lichenicoccus sp. TaxID=2781899 RepID=UPI003D0AC31F
MNRAAAYLGTASIALLATLSACGPDDPNAFAPDCVPVGILGPAADLSSFAGPSRDLDTLVTRASIAGVNGACSNAEQGRALATQVNVTIGVMRGPAATVRHITIPYFVAVLHGNDIVAKHLLSIEADFPPNVDRLALRSAPLDLTLPISRRMSSASYRLEVGLQLTPEQLAYNRAHPPQ